MSEELENKLDVVGTNAKCKNCGGNLVFDPKTQSLVCPNCDSHFPFDKKQEEIKHKIEESKEKDDTKKHDSWAKEMKVVKCDTCGAEIILSGRIWLDETYYTVELKDIELKEDGTKPRGLSKNQLCIGVACTDTKILCLFEGNGKPSKKKTYSAFKDHIAAGSTLVHDKEAAHSLLVEKLNLVSEVYNSKELKKLEDKDNPLKRVNEVHARLKNFLLAHNSFSRESLQGYLNLFTLAMNPPTDNLEKVELLLNSAFKTRKTLRYRDFYKVN